MDAGVWILSRHPCRLLWLLCSWGWKWHWHNKCNNNHPDNQVNDRIGRCGAGGGTAHLTSLKRVRDWCDQHGVLFKVMLFDIFVCQALWIFSFSSWTRWWTATTGWRTWSSRLTSSVRSAGRWLKSTSGQGSLRQSWLFRGMSENLMKSNTSCNF